MKPIKSESGLIVCLIVGRKERVLKKCLCIMIFSTLLHTIKLIKEWQPISSCHYLSFLSRAFRLVVSYQIVSRWPSQVVYTSIDKIINSYRHYTLFGISTTYNTSKFPFVAFNHFLQKHVVQPASPAFQFHLKPINVAIAGSLLEGYFSIVIHTCIAYKTVVMLRYKVSEHSPIATVVERATPPADAE